MRIKKLFNFAFECESKVFAVIFALYALGLVYGCFSASVTESVTGQIGTYSVNDITASDNLFSLFAKNFIVLLIIFLSGFSVIGVPFICISVIYCGVSCGAFFIFVSYSYGLKGTILAAICFFIYYLLNFLSFASVAFSSLRLSLALFNVFKVDTRYVSPRFYSTPHILKFMFFSLFIGVSSIYYIYFARNLLNMLI